MYRKVNTEEESKILQSDIDKLYEWARIWQLKFNAAKCKVMHKGYSNRQENYTMEGLTLEKVFKEKDLGVTIDNELKFHDHVQLSVTKANQILGIVKRTFSCLDKEILPIVYKCQVRPHLEYGNVIWHPRYVANISKVEQVQRRATKLIPGFQDKTYEDRLKELKLYSMEYRRKRGDYKIIYKIINEIDRIHPSQLFQFATGNTRGHSKKLFKQSVNKDVRKHVFSQRVIDAWNSLTEDIISSKSLNIFKAKLDKHWESEWYEISTE